ncbi:MAG: DUF951 domain-containing protein [Candidatus Izemoplasmataceae bacterium]
METDKFGVGKIVTMKKQHPCGENKWEIIRYGADVKLKCTRCERVVMIDRVKFLRNVKKLLN